MKIIECFNSLSKKEKRIIIYLLFALEIITLILGISGGIYFSKTNIITQERGIISDKINGGINQSNYDNRVEKAESVYNNPTGTYNINPQLEGYKLLRSSNNNDTIIYVKQN